MLSKSSLLVAGVSGGLLAWLFGPALWGGQSFVYRDASHYYYPLFEWISGQVAAGQWPWWNPHENLGVPLAGDNTASLFYPGKLMFALPLDYTLRYNGYIVTHVALAAWGAYRLARHWGASVAAAAIASLSYAFGGSVLFQTCNVIFLIGAAWLPWALLAADQMLAQRRVAWVVLFGAVLALMVTGGDPQMAYNVVLLAGLDALLRWRCDCRATSAAMPTQANSWSKSRPALLAASCLVALALAAVQVLPAAEATARSGRAAYDAPRNVYELCASLGSLNNSAQQTAWYAGLMGRESAGHQGQIYYFELPPWRLMELLWPSVSGQAFPTYRRWGTAFGWEGSVWTVSLYAGLLPLGLAVVAWSIRRRANVETRLASWMVLLGTLASFGSYGAAWLVSQVVASGLAVGDEVGGLYWWLTVLLPGYVYFRYPAKLFVIASLGISLLAARGWDTAWQSGHRNLGRLWIALALVSMSGMTAYGWVWPPIAADAEQGAADVLLGPFDSAGAGSDIWSALCHAAAVASVLAVLFVWSKFRPQHASAVAAVCVLLVAVDLAIAQRSLFAYGPAEAWRREGGFARELPPDTKNYRVFRQLRVLPESWREQSSGDRLVEALLWNRATLAPKFELGYGLSLAEAGGPTVPFDYAVLLDASRTPLAHRGEMLPSRSMLDLIAARAVITERGNPRDDIVDFGSLTNNMVGGLWPTALPRARITHEVATLPTLIENSPSAIVARSQEFLAAYAARPTQAMVESEQPVDPPPEPTADASRERCEILTSQPTCVELDVRMESAGLLVLADQFYPGWSATVETDGKARTVPIVRTNCVMRGVALPAGRHRVTFRYRPVSLMLGGAISAVALLGLVAWAGASRWPRRKVQPGSGRT